MTDNADVASVTSSVIFVSELDRSVRFYTEVFGCTTSVRQEAGALLLTPGGFQLYLIAKGDRAVHETGNLGAQYLMWATETPEALTRFEEKLKSLDCHSYTHTSTEITFVEGHDPDWIRVVIAHPSPEQYARSTLDNRLYN